MALTLETPRSYPDSVYKHLRKSLTVPSKTREEDMDDFYSPMPPAKYVLLRLQPAIVFYQDRIPVVACRRRVLQALVLLCTLSSSVLSYLGYSVWVPLVASLYSSLAAWQEFAGLDQKLRRYNEAVQALKGIKSWWTSLTKVERASPDRINRLVDNVEDA